MHLQKLLLSVMVLLMLGSCSKEKQPTKEEIAQRQKEITLWMDSLLATTSTFRLSPNEGAIMLRSQERYFQEFNHFTNLHIVLTKDTVGIKHLIYLDIRKDFDRFIPIVKSHTQDLIAYQSYEPEKKRTVTLQIAQDCPIEHIRKVLALIKNNGYATLIFVGEFKTQHKVPHLPDSVYYKKMRKSMADAPAAVRASALAEFVGKHMNKYEETEEIFHTCANIPANQRDSFMCKSLPPVIADKKDYKIFMTICYAPIAPLLHKKQVQSGGKSFYIHPTKEILKATPGVWSDISDSIFALEADTLMVQRRVYGYRRITPTNTNEE